MRLLEYSYGDKRVFSERPFGYKRFVVESDDGTLHIFSSMWYSLKQVVNLVVKGKI